MKTLTIFTPVYNRAYILPKLYNSLCTQKCKDFIWLVVNDGSSDNVDELMHQWISEARIDIKYVTQPNGGKMRAHNKGVELCETPLFFCIDSDDQIENDAVSSIIHLYSKIADDEKVAGMIAKRRIVNRKSSVNMPNFDYSTIRNLYASGFVGDTSIVFKTNVIKQFKFPEIKGEKFITEAYVYDQIDINYSYLIKDEYWMICEYQEDGYTSNALSLYFKHPKGWALYHAQSYRLFAHSLRAKVKTMGYYIAMCKIAKMGFWESVINSPSWIFYMISIPAGLKFYKRYVTSYMLYNEK